MTADPSLVTGLAASFADRLRALPKEHRASPTAHRSEDLGTDDLPAPISLRIDGRTVAVAPGTNVLEAARGADVDICHFCYHPGLSIAASCRQCLVEIDGTPKLVPSCQVTVQEGMSVHTNSPKVLEARRAMLEFTLVNHPIDCPICDKAGECTLQRHYMAHDHRLTRVDVPKIRKPKRKDIGEHILLDAERCILCSRCVRFCDEVSGTHELVMTHRGAHEEIDVAPGLRLDNPYSLNVVDLCPVGALTNKDFRFQARVWDLRATPTTCQGCATGCAIELHTRDDTAHRVVPRFDGEVNGHFMCDEGRFTYQHLEPSRRVHRPKARTPDGTLTQALAEIRDELLGKRLAVVFSKTASNEANLALDAFATATGATRFIVGRARGPGDDYLRSSDKNPNSPGALSAAGPQARHEDELALSLAGGGLEAVLFLDGSADLTDLARAALPDLVSICLADETSPLASACRFVLPAASWAEVRGTTLDRRHSLRVMHPAWPPLPGRRDRVMLLRDLLTAMGFTPSFETPAQLTTALAGSLGEADPFSPQAAGDDHPRLLRWAHSRG